MLTKDNRWRKASEQETWISTGKGREAGKGPVSRPGRETASRIRRFSTSCASYAIFRLKDIPPEQWLLLEHILTILRYAAAELRVVFAERSVVDFVELGLAAREVLRDERGGPSEVAAGMALRWPHLLVDEFQDTSRAQYELLALLAAATKRHGMGTLFLVGDPMQSIYGFRQAEVELFEATRRHGLGGECMRRLWNRSN